MHVKFRGTLITRAGKGEQTLPLEPRERCRRERAILGEKH